MQKNFTLLVIALMIGLMIFSLNGKTESSPPKALDSQTFEEILASGDFSGIEVLTQFKVWNQMHLMANTLILADAIWGEIVITEELVNSLLVEVLASDFNDRDRLAAILWRWKAGDFRQGVEDHNYVWECLGGNIGRAHSLRPEIRR